MNQLEIVLAQPMAQALGWALIHFVWQGVAVAILAALGLAALSRRSAEIRYITACSALLLMLAFPAGTVIYMLSTGVEEPSPGAGAAAAGPDAQDWFVFDRGVAEQVAGADGTGKQDEQAAAGWIDWTRTNLQLLLPWLLSIWFAGVLAMSIRLAGGWAEARRLRRVGTREASPSLQAVLLDLVRKMRVTRPVRLLESTLAQVPAAVGWLRPAILLPAGTLTGLTPGQMEAMIAHELAHIRRHDFLVNFIQSVVETLLFYHPAVWWISNRIRVEREYCCDDMAVAVCGDAVGYARALAEMETLRDLTPQAAMAATGGSLLARVRRLIHPHAARRHLLSGLLAWLCVLGALASAGAFATLSVAWSETPLPPSADLVEEPELRLQFQTEILERTVALLYMGEEACLEGLEDADWITRAAAARCLAERGAEEESETLVEALEDETWWVRKEAAQAYASLGVEKAPAALIDLLEDGDAEVRELAARALGRIGDGKARKALRAAKEDQSARVREAADWALGAVSDAAEQESLIEGLEDKDPQVRENAALVLGEIADPEAAGALALALDDKKKTVREAAGWALGQVGTDEAVSSLVSGLENEKKEIRKRTVYALGEMGNPAAVKPLLRTLEKDKEPAVREAAAKSLMVLADRSSYEGLVYALEDKSWKVRHYAAKALGEIGETRAIKPLEAALKDEVKDVRKAADWALGVLEKRLEKERKKGSESKKKKEAGEK